MKKKALISASKIFLLFSILILFSPNSFLNLITEPLVHEDPLKSAEAIVVLSGSGTGNRIEAGAHLFSMGLGKVMIFSGAQYYPGVTQYELMRDLAIKLGVPKNKMIAKEIKGENSTWGEGIRNLKILKENNIKSFILVTSAFHTNRAHAVYEQLIADSGYDIKFLVYPAKDNMIPVKGWWKTRTGQKHILLEYLSTLNFYREH